MLVSRLKACFNESEIFINQVMQVIKFVTGQLKRNGVGMGIYVN